MTLLNPRGSVLKSLSCLSSHIRKIEKPACGFLPLPCGIRGFESGNLHIQDRLQIRQLVLIPTVLYGIKYSFENTVNAIIYDWNKLPKSRLYLKPYSNHVFRLD